MRKYYRLTFILLIFTGLAVSSCKTHKDCGGRRKKKVMTQMGGYM